MGLLGGFGEYLQTPEAQGLLSATFGGMAAAGRGGPWNTAGAAGMSGLLGYSQAVNSQADQQQKKFMLDMARQEAGVSPLLSQTPFIPNTKKGNVAVNDVMFPIAAGQTGSPQPDIGQAGQLSVPTQPATWYGEAAIQPTSESQQPTSQAPAFDPAATMRRIKALSWIDPAKANSMRDNLKFQMEGVAREQGKTYQMLDGTERAYAKLESGQVQAPDGSISFGNGYVPAMTDYTDKIEVAKTKAQAGNTTAPYEMWPEIGGKKVPVTMAWLQNKQPGQAPGMAQPSYQGEDILNQLPPTVRDGILESARKTGGSAFNVNYQLPGGRIVNGAVNLAAAPQATQQATPQPSSVASYSPTQQTAGEPMWPTDAQKRDRIGGVDTRIQAGQKLNDNWITSSYNPVLQAGESARALQASLDALNNIDIKTGWGTSAQSSASNILTSLGIAPENAKEFATNAQKFQSVAMDRLLVTLQAQKGIQTEGDAQRAAGTFASLQNTPEANQFIADFARAKANNDLRRVQFYQEALPIARQSGDLTEVDRQWTKIQGSIWNDPILQRWKKGK